MIPMKKYIIPHLRVAELDMKDGVLQDIVISGDDNGENALDVKGQAAWDGWSDEDDEW